MKDMPIQLFEMTNNMCFFKAAAEMLTMVKAIFVAAW